VVLICPCITIDFHIHLLVHRNYIDVNNHFVETQAIPIFQDVLEQHESKVEKFLRLEDH